MKSHIYVLALAVCTLLLVGCGDTSSTTPPRDSPAQPTGLLPPRLVSPNSCQLTADKYTLPVGAQNKYYLYADSGEVCDINQQKLGDWAATNVRNFRIPSSGTKTEIVNQMETGLFDIWAVCGKCTSEKLRITVTSSDSNPIPPTSGLNCQNECVSQGFPSGRGPVNDFHDCVLDGPESAIGQAEWGLQYCCCENVPLPPPAAPVYICCPIQRVMQCTQGPICPDGSRPIQQYGDFNSCDANCGFAVPPAPPVQRTNAECQAFCQSVNPIYDFGTARNDGGCPAGTAVEDCCCYSDPDPPPQPPPMDADNTCSQHCVAEWSIPGYCGISIGPIQDAPCEQGGYYLSHLSADMECNAGTQGAFPACCCMEMN